MTEEAERRKQADAAMTEEAEQAVAAAVDSYRANILPLVEQLQQQVHDLTAERLYWKEKAERLECESKSQFDSRGAVLGEREQGRPSTGPSS